MTSIEQSAARLEALADRSVKQSANVIRALEEADRADREATEQLLEATRELSLALDRVVEVLS